MINPFKPFRSAALFVLLAVFSQCTDEVIEPSKRTEDDLTVSATNIASPIDCSSCTYVVPLGKYTVDGLAIGIKPGDVICLNAALNYHYLAFKNINGESGNDITIINCGGTVVMHTPDKPYVIKIYNSKNFRFSGGNVSKTYGIKLSGASGNGLVLGPFATNFKVNNVEIHDVGFAGIMAKTDPTCDDATTRGNFTMRNVYINSNYIHDTHGEGMYIGHSSYGGVNNATCGLRLPHLIENIRVYKNLVRRSGWDAIQVSCASKDAFIYQNTIEDFSTANKDAQRSGICIGGGTGGVCYANLINKGNGPGMSVFGLANNLIHDNIIISPSTSGIFCDERTEPGPGYRFIHNTIINPGTEGLRLYAELVPDNVLANNIIVNPGTPGAYVVKYKAAPLQLLNNHFTANISDVKFVNPGALNYRLSSLSPLIDKGYDVTSYNILTDFYGAARRKGITYDIGAAEY
jgi:hypothetical protein